MDSMDDKLESLDGEHQSSDGLLNELDVSYEQERMENIKNNAALLSSLGLNGQLSIRPPKPSTPKSRPKASISSAEERTRKQTRAKEAALKRTLEPSRRSSRVAGKAAPDYTTDGANPPSPSLGPVGASGFAMPSLIPRQLAPVIPSGPQYDDDQIFEPAPRPGRDTDGSLIFEGRWKGVFNPNVTPEEMFNGGAFAGGFFADVPSRVLKIPLSSSEDISALPFDPPSSKIAAHYTNPDPDGDLNRFKVRAGQSLQEWEKAGWIWPGDPRGWAQWYLRFWAGRRCEDDERQVKRWLKVAGPTGRFKRALMKKIYMAGGVQAGGLADEDVGRVLRQCLWQWGYELTEVEYERAMEVDDG